LRAFGSMASHSATIIDHQFGELVGVAGTFLTSRAFWHGLADLLNDPHESRNVITSDFAAWARTHDKELRAAESRWGIRAGRDIQLERPDAWEPDDYYRGESGVVHAPDARSIFDDVDE
jgi:hypothetical protein